MTDPLRRGPIVIAQDARCSAVTQQGRYCLRPPSSDLPEHLALPPFVQFCDQHISRAVEHWICREIARADARAEQAERRAAEERRKAAEATVYYVRRADGLVKIGYSGQFRNRLRALQLEHGPLDVLATHAGGRAAEKYQHLRWAGARVKGEWFRPVPELMAHIQHVAARRAAAPAQHEGPAETGPNREGTR